jgi:hypothetical protein
MKFNNYLTEANISLSKIIETVDKDCQPMLTMCKHRNVLFTRYYERMQTRFQRFVPRTDRRPRSTSLLLHNSINEMFMKKFGWAGRSGVFTYIVPSNFILTHGNYLFFSDGKFRIIYHPKINDLFMTLIDIEVALFGEDSWLEAKKPKNAKLVLDKFKTDWLPGYSDSISQLAISQLAYANQGFEVMFDCSAYYLCKFDRELVEHIFK